MQTPITREIAQLSQGNLLRSLPSMMRFVARIVGEGRGNELFFNALREIRYGKAAPYDMRDAAEFGRDNLSELNTDLGPKLAELGYEKILEFASSEEDKCLIIGEHLVCMTRRALRFYDSQRKLLRCVESDGFLSNFVHVAGRLYYVVNGSLYSVTFDEEVRNENLSLSSPKSSVLDQGIAADASGNLVVAEYKHTAYGQSGAFLYFRRAGDESWTTIDVLARRVDKHCHIVVFDSAAQMFYVTCGDTRKMVARFKLTDAEVNLEIISASAGKTGGYMCAEPWEGGLICGTDYTGGTNFLVQVRGDRVRRKEAVRSPFRRSIVSSMDTNGKNLLFASWNMGFLPKCCNGILVKTPTEMKPLCYSEDSSIRFELFPSADGLIIHGAFDDNQVFGVYQRT